jgi:hypothetical protein
MQHIAVMCVRVQMMKFREGGNTIYIHRTT